MEKPVALFVDDSTRSLELMEKIMNISKVKSIFTNCAEEAVGILKGCESIKVVFLDIIMPGINGFDLANEIRESFPKRKFKFCFVTAMRDEKHITKAINHGVIDYIVKPFDVSIVKDRLFKLLGDSFREEQFYSKDVDFNVNIENVPFLMNLKVKELSEIGGMFVSQFEFEEGVLFSIGSSFLSSHVPTEGNKFCVVVKEVLKLDNCNKVYFEFVDMSEDIKKKLRSFVIT